MSGANHPNLVSQRPEAYATLFKGEMLYDDQPPIHEVGLNGLWRAYSVKHGSISVVMEEHLQAVPTFVSAILHENDEKARDPDYQGDAIFSIASPSYLSDVIDITSRIIKFWEKALDRNKEALLFKEPSGFAARSLTLETAAAVLQTLPIFAKRPIQGVSETDKKRLATVLANWGPNFLQSWLDGTIAGEWLAKEGTPPGEIQDWQCVFSPSQFKYFAYKNVPAPLKAIRAFKAGYESMTDEAIIQHTGWTLEAVQDIMTPGVRKRIVATNITDPFRGLAKVKENLAQLTDEAIAERLQWTKRKASDIITPAMRKIIAVNYMGDPFAAIDRLKASLELLTTERIAEHLQRSPLYVEQTFTPRDMLYIARHYTDPLGALKKVIHNLDLLSDQSVSEYLGLPLHKVKDIEYPEGKVQFAMSNTVDPLRALRKRLTKLGLHS